MYNSCAHVEICKSCTHQTASRGLFIVIEGLDHSGKDTLITKLVSLFEIAKKPSFVQAFPDRTTASGALLDQFLQKKLELGDWDCHNIYAQNRRELQEKLRDTLLKGTTIICNRYAYSGVTYTAAKGYDLLRCMEADRNLLQPDLVVFLDVDASIVATRNSFGEERYETMDFQARVYHAFQALWQLLNYPRSDLVESGEKEKSGDSPELLIIPSNELDGAPERIFQIYSKMLRKNLQTPLDSLFSLI